MTLGCAAVTLTLIYRYVNKVINKYPLLLLTLAVVTSCGKHVVILAVELRGVCQEVGLNTKFKYDVGQFEDCGYSMEAIYSSSDQDYDSGDKRGTKR